MSLISCLIITSLSLASRDKKSVKQRVFQRVQKREFTESIGSESVNHMSLITCHSSHVTHLMSHHYVTQLMSLISCLNLMWLISCLDLMSLITKSLISCLITTSLISCLIITSLISCLFITSLILRCCLYTLGWPHFTSTHHLCPLVTA